MNTHFCNKIQANRQGQCCDCHCAPALEYVFRPEAVAKQINDILDAHSAKLEFYPTNGLTLFNMSINSGAEIKHAWRVVETEA